jgi:AcrR family transcriptional regulator
MSDVREELLREVANALTANPGASTGEIALTARVSRATLHRTFGTREELVGTVYDWLLEQCNLIFDRCGIEDGPVLDTFDLLVEDSYPLAQSYWLLIAKPELESVPAIKQGIEKLDARLEEFFVRGQKEGLFRPDLPSRWLVYSLGSQVMSAWYLVDEGYAGPREVPRLVRSAVLDGVRARTGE